MSPRRTSAASIPAKLTGSPSTSSRAIRVIVGGVTLADSTNTKRVLETSHPPTIYVPRADVVGTLVKPTVPIEAGAAAENVHLQCESLELATVIVGAFLDEEVKTVLQLPEGEEAYLLMPIGRRGSR